MKVTYDSHFDIIRIVLREGPVAESDEDKPGVILDYDAEGNVVGLEILDASKRIENSRAVDRNPSRAKQNFKIPRSV